MSTFSISLPHDIALQVDSETKNRGFATRSEFIRALLRSYFSNQQSFAVFKSQPLEQIKFELAKSGKYSQKFIESVISGLKKSSQYAK